MTHSSFIHLRVRSSYSLLEGAITPAKLVDMCKEQQMPAIAVTDINNLFASLEFSLAAMKAGIQPIIGCVLSVAYEPTKENNQPELFKVPLLVQNETGYYNLLKLVSQAYTEAPAHEPSHVKIAQIKKYNEGLIAFTGSVDSILGKHLGNDQKETAEKYLNIMLNIFGDRLYFELMRHGIDSERKIETPILDLGYKYNIPFVATNDVYFADKSIHEAHDAMLCIADQRYVDEENRRKITPDYYFKTPLEMEKLFADIPEAINNTINIAKRCAFSSPVRDPILPHFPTTEGRTEVEELTYVANKGLQKRLTTKVFTAEHNKEEKAELEKQYQARLDYELGVIIQMKFPGYFLIVSDFIIWSKRNDIPVGPGRGSGAGSLVAWSLEITDLDPIHFGLIFERFLNPERISMPDFDIDFCQYKRDRVITYVQQKYGKNQVAQIITFGKLQARAVLRDLGRVLQMPYPQVDRICKLIPNNPAQPVTLAEAIAIEPDLRRAQKEDQQTKKLLKMGLQLEGLNRHCSTHAAGIVISDRPLDELVPIYRDPRSDMPVTQYSMKYAESAGLVKFDFLGLKTLTVIKEAVDLINSRGGNINIDNIPLNEPKTYEIMSRGDTIGVFQIESTGMRDTLCKMRPDCINDIIALISLYRPGPMDNIPEYIACKHGEQQINYPHPMLEEILIETNGVIIYQEQVLKIAQVLSGYTLGAADILRRAMGKKIKAEMDQQREIFVEGAVQNNVDAKQADEIFDLVAKFAGYGFNKSHAAAYALISYQTGYLKANYPIEFFVASMNLDINDTEKLTVFCRDAKKWEITILQPNINKSQSAFSIENDEDGVPCIRYALGALKNVGSAAMEIITTDRKENGKFTDIYDLAARCDSKTMNKRQIESLSKAGAFDCFSPNRQIFCNNVDILTSYSAMITQEKESSQVNLFGDTAENDIDKPQLNPTEDWDKIEKINKEQEAIGFYLNNHPLDNYKDKLDGMGFSFSNELDKHSRSSKDLKCAGVVTAKRIRNSRRGKYAFIQLSDHNGLYEVSIFDQDLLSKSLELISSSTPMVVFVDVKKDDSGTRFIASNIIELEEYLNKNHSDRNIKKSKKYNFTTPQKTYSSTPATNPNQSLTIRANTIASIKALKDILKSNHGKSQIKLIVKLDDYSEAELKLGNSYDITENALNKIKNIPELLVEKI